MYNELLFFAHALVVSAGVLLALRHSYGALLTVLSIQIIAANIFVTKQIALFGMHTTCSEVFIVGGMYGMSLVRDYYSSFVARRCVRDVFGFFLLFTILAHFHMAYSGVDSGMSAALVSVCGSTLRLFAASMVAYFASERIHLWLKTQRVIAISIGQLVDTVLFALVGLWGLVDSVWPVIFFSLLVKGIIVATLSPMLLIARRWCQPQEKGIL